MSVAARGAHTIHLAENFALAVTGFDSVPRHIELASAQLAARVALHPELTGRVRFELLDPPKRCLSKT